MENLQILPSNEYKEVEGRSYLTPTLRASQTDEFIDKLREVQRGNTQEIVQQTEALGTSVPSNEGGLLGSSSYLTSRYQTPQTNALAENLRAAAQASALNQALQNEQAMWKKRYDEAYKNRQKRDYDKANQPIAQIPDNTTRGGVEEEPSGEELTNLTAKQDMNKYGVNTDVYDSTEVHHDNRSTQQNRKIGVTKDKNGNVTTLTVDGVKHYGREARAKYRYLKNAGLVR